MKHLVFGDIHTRLDLVCALIEKAQKENLKLLSVGDIFHGPNGRLGLDCFDLLVKEGCQFIASNHDFIHVLYLKAIEEGLSPEDAVRAADFHCKHLPNGDDKLERIKREVQAEIEVIGEERLNLISSFPFSRHFGDIFIYHAKPGEGLDAIDDADAFWQQVIKGELCLNGTVVVGHEGDFAKQYNKMIFEQKQGRVIALDLKAKKGGNVGYIVIDENNEIIEIGKF